MSDDEADPELLELLRQHLRGSTLKDAPPSTGVLKSAEYVYDNSIDVALDMRSTKAAARLIHDRMQKSQYSTKNWASHDLHPKTKDDSTLNFIFTMDLQNFSFWSERNAEERFAIEYKGQRWTGYWSLVAGLQRALDEGIPITTSDFWQNEHECTLEVLQHIFRSTTTEEMPLLPERLAILREAGHVLYTHFSCSITNLIRRASNSAARLVNLLVEHFPCFADVHSFGSKSNIKLLKRAQIFVADLWAAFEGEGLGRFDDIDSITMFADYRVPQILNALGCMWYAPGLEARIRERGMLVVGGEWEVQLRGCSIWCIELIRREIVRNHPEAKINAILIDFFLYDMAAEFAGTVPHHRTRSIWY